MLLNQQFHEVQFLINCDPYDNGYIDLDIYITKTDHEIKKKWEEQNEIIDNISKSFHEKFNLLEKARRKDLIKKNEEQEFLRLQKKFEQKSGEYKFYLKLKEKYEKQGQKND